MDYKNQTHIEKDHTQWRSYEELDQKYQESFDNIQGFVWGLESYGPCKHKAGSEQ